MANTPHTRRRFLRDAGLAGAAVSALPMIGPPAARAQSGGGPVDWTQHPNPIVRENRGTPQGSWSGAFQVSVHDADVVTGFARQTSVNVGEPVDLVLWGPDRWYDPVNPSEGAEIEVYRLGYYGGSGGRRVWQSGRVVSSFQSVANGEFAQTPPNGPGAKPLERPLDAQTGLLGHADLRTSATVPGTALTVSGVYLAKLKTRWTEYPPGVAPVARTGEAHIIFIVRDDERPRDLLVHLPTNTWQAYNYWSGRSVYSSQSPDGGQVPATKMPRAAKVSFDRPHNNWVGDFNWVLRTEFPAIWWLEQQGYDLAYTEDVALTYAPEQLLPENSSAVAILGHGEYWTQEIRDGMEAARDAGTHLFNFGANTAYWRVRYETTTGAEATGVDDARVMVCYKTIEGGGDSRPDLGSDADPVLSTSTWRDPGKGPGIAVPGTANPNTPDYVGPGRPEAELLGVQYIGNDNSAFHRMAVPADNGADEFAGHRAWRHTPLYRATTPQQIDRPLIGWEWDAVPTGEDPYGGAPPPVHPRSTGLKRLSETDVIADAPAGNDVQFLLDAGRAYGPAGTDEGAEPPPYVPGTTEAITYRAPSGAVVFSAGTIQWSWGLGPHFHTTNYSNYSQPRVDDTHPVIRQATANLLADEGIFPATPEPELVIEPLAEPDLVIPEPDPDPDPGPGPGPGDPGPGGPGQPSPPGTPPGGTGSGGTGNPPVAQPGPSRLIFDLAGTRVTRTGRIEGRVRLNSDVAKVAGRVRGTVEFTALGDVVAKGRFTIRAGGRRSTTLRLRLSPWARRYVARKGELRLTARITITAGTAGPKRTQTRLRVRRPGRR